MTEELSEVSVIIPCRHEAEWIERCLMSVIANDYPHDHLEVFVVDGMSEDGTREIVKSIAEQHPFIMLLDNPRKSAPAALNIGIAAASGDVIMRMDAHNEYVEHYISSLVAWLNKSGADNVGGVWVTRAANETAIARAIADAQTHRFGIGNAHYRLGTSEPRYVDTVPFGCYRREVFDRIGGFDEELLRNQDIEMNHRLRRNGGSILLVPDVESYYYARSSLGTFAKMSFQNGYFNPLVVRKTGGRITLRQIVPPLFVLSLFLTGILAPFVWTIRVALIAILSIYFLCTMAVALSFVPKRGWPSALALTIVFPLLHMSHGFGFLKGLFDFVVLRRTVGENAGSVPLTR